MQPALIRQRQKPTGGWRRLLLRFFVCLALPASAFAADSLRVAALRDAAQTQRLDTLQDWIALGRWHGRPGHWKSGVDGGYFYLDPHGRTDPRRELDATLRALLTQEDISPFAHDTTAVHMHPLVKYRARLRFLKAHLPLGDSDLPQVDISRWNRWHDGVRPSRATLVYASSYLGNPASMFGHVLIRLDAGDREGLRDRLNYGVTYGAAMPPGDPLYMIKGLAGLYPGFYTLLPYYVSLQKYKYLESRDLWEYPLRLDSIQTERLLENIWEEGAAWNRYYFFTMNCATGVTHQLDALLPNHRYLERTTIPSMPPEVVRQLREDGLAGPPRRRPSQLATFLARRDAMDVSDRAELRRLIDNGEFPRDTSDAVRTARILDAGIDLIGWKHRKSPKDTLLQRRLASLLERRAHLGPMAKEIAVEDSSVQPPEAGHKPRILAAWAGRGPDGAPEIGLQARLAYHSLEERPDGFLDGSHVEAGLIELGISRNEVFLNRAEVFNLRSLGLWDSWLRRPAWSLRNSVRPLENGSRLPWWGQEGGIGLCGGLPWLRIWAMAEARAIWAPWHDASSAAFGPQARAGVLLQGRRASLREELVAFRGFPDRKAKEEALETDLRVSLSSQWDWQLGGWVDSRQQWEAHSGAAIHF